jgi:hypothetical protein
MEPDREYVNGLINGFRQTALIAAAVGSHAELHRDSATYREVCKIQQVAESSSA